jgi:hypothetical protein
MNDIRELSKQQPAEIGSGYSFGDRLAGVPDSGRRSVGKNCI